MISIFFEIFKKKFRILRFLSTFSDFQKTYFWNCHLIYFWSKNLFLKILSTFFEILKNK